MRYAFFFVATSIAVFASYFVIGGVATGLLALAVAELLIRRAHFTQTGVEAALWLGGLCAFIASLPSHGKPEAILVFAAAAAIAGARVRNPWFGALAVVLVLFYLDEKHLGAPLVATVGQAIAIAAALARARTWRLAWIDRLFGAIAIAAPLAAFKDVWAIDLIGGAIVLTIALRLRDRMLLIAAAVSLTVAAVDAGRLLDHPLEWKLIPAGAALVAASLILTRVLRGRTTGIVITPAPARRYEEAATIAATILMQPAQATSSDSASRFEGGGGDGGGAGASDSF